MSRGIPRHALLHHFFTSFKWPFPYNYEASQLLALGNSQPFLLDTLLAVAASHLRHHSVVKQPSRLAEQSQGSLALNGFRAALQRPRDDPKTAEAIVLTALFLNVLFFSAVEDDDPAKSWIFSRQPDRLAWLSLQLGFKPLVMSTNAFRRDDVFTDVFCLPQVFYYIRLCSRYTGLCSRTTAVFPLHWQHLFGSDGHKGRVFHDPARVALHLSHIEPTCDNFFLYCKFFVVMDIELRFRDLLEREDERAVWLFGYWLGLLNRFQFWWTGLRVRMEWTAIRLWLDRRGVRGRSMTWIKLMRDLDTAAEWPQPAQEEPDEVTDMDHVQLPWPRRCQEVDSWVHC
ncbi:hypothetical protein L249_1243 [Ophiocordyceps polyrhachis-furcata BCC 54312]|uniref:Transcription factor domain-containing protein n=1 Tax=Ophiocordyceps polyrhachis-furcata BCC 54312 TaxID=1330021 RepID=A0A367LC66_9HYPO|nr:hypothetical protein L249_1243 [Ophiocordyceps polyrhachis-furcata BCC 54312]